MDIRAMMRAQKAAKASERAQQQKALALIQQMKQKTRSQAAARSRQMEPPPPAKQIPGAAAADDSSSRMMPPPPPPPPKQRVEKEVANPQLPGGFFDERGVDSHKADQRQGDNDTEEGKSGGAPGTGGVDNNGGGGLGAALPVGFFDDVERDAVVHNIDLERERVEREASDLKELMVSSAGLVKSLEAMQADEERAMEEDVKRNSMEQGKYMQRLAGLLQKSESVNSKGEGGKRPSSPPPTKDATETSGAIDVGEILMRRGKRRKVEAKAAREGVYTPLDPLDWRKKYR